MIMNDQEMLEDLKLTRNLSQRTQAQYKQTIKSYTSFNSLNFQELLDEAEAEEEQGIRWKHRKIKNRLIQFKHYLINNYKKKTVKTYFSIIIRIYKHYEIEIHQLPHVSEKNMKDNPPVSFNDLPDKKIIKKALKITTPVMRAIILFMVSTGCARNETLHITIQDFIDATKDYHNSNDIYEVLNTLKDREDIVPMFKIKRRKTGKHYYTFSTPEATTETINYLLSKDIKLKPNDTLFKYNHDHFSRIFTDINTALGLGKIGSYGRFRSHMLRKFHASSLYNHDNGLDMDMINALQGKTKNSTDESYFMENPEDLKKAYIKAMDCLCINLDVNNLNIKTPEYLEMENKVVEAENIKNEMEDLKKRIMAIEQDDHIRQYETPNSIKQKHQI